ARAPLVAGTPLRVTAFLISPESTTLARSVPGGTTPALSSASRSTTAASTLASSFRRTSARVRLMSERKPTFRMRRCTRIWPPPTPPLWSPPLPARSPFVRRPPVLPCPAEAPRPTRRRGRRAPGAGFSVFSRIALCLVFHAQQVHGSLDHAAILARVLHRNR